MPVSKNNEFMSSESVFSAISIGDRVTVEIKKNVLKSGRAVSRDRDGCWLVQLKDMLIKVDVNNIVSVKKIGRPLKKAERTRSQQSYRWLDEQKQKRRELIQNIELHSKSY